MLVLRSKIVDILGGDLTVRERWKSPWLPGHSAARGILIDLLVPLKRWNSVDGRGRLFVVCATTS
jgi:hypothetical protein